MIVKQNMYSSLSRRHVLMGMGALATAGLAPRIGFAQDYSRLKGSGEVVVCTWGGSSTEIMKDVWFSPFSKTTGIDVQITNSPDLAKLEVMIKSGNIEWDLVDSEGNQYITAVGKGLFEPIDYDLLFSIVPKEQLDPTVMLPYGVGSVAFSTVIGWNTKAVGKDGPQSWAEFFDAKRFKGRRALYARPKPSFEIALLAAGVPKDKIYPIKIDEAFEALDAIRDKVDLWVEQSAQWSLLMQNNEVDMTAAGLALTSREKVGGNTIDYTFNEALAEQSYWTIPKGAPGAANAQKLIAFMMQAEGMRAHALRRPVDIANKSIYADLPVETAKGLPGYPDNAEKGLKIDAKWWSDNGAAVQPRWLEWISKR